MICPSRNLRLVWGFPSHVWWMTLKGKWIMISHVYCSIPLNPIKPSHEILIPWNPNRMKLRLISLSPMKSHSHETMPLIKIPLARACGEVRKEMAAIEESCEPGTVFSAGWNRCGKAMGRPYDILWHPIGPMIIHDLQILVKIHLKTRLYGNKIIVLNYQQDEVGFRII